MSRAFFQATAIATLTFVMTVLAMIAMLVGSPDAPVNLWFNQHGGTIMVVEVLLIVFLGLLAMIFDRRETIRQEQLSRSAAPVVTASSVESSDDSSSGIQNADVTGNSSELPPPHEKSN